MSVLFQSLRGAVAISSSVVLCVSLAVTAADTKTSEVNIYSARQEALIKPLLDEFTTETGIAVNLVTGKGDALLTRLQNEGKNSPADILLTTDAGRLYRAQEAGVLQPFASETLKNTIPAHLRSADDYWYGLSIRARFIVYAKDRVKPSELDSYESLADDKWRRRVCIRSSNNIYNQSLIAGMISSRGEEKTAVWLDKFVENFARPPQGGDRDQIKAVAAGQCDVAVVNSYYLGAMLNSSNADEREAATKVAVFWPNQSDRGTHINVSGAGITVSAKHPEQAQQLIEFLARNESQKWYAETNMEFPASPDVQASALLKSWGEYKADPLDVTELGRLNARAVMAMDRAHWK